MVKKIVTIVSCIVLIVLLGYIFTNNNVYKSFLTDSGEEYNYIEHDYKNFVVKNIELGYATREELINCLSNKLEEEQPLGQVTGVEDALEKGIYALNKCYEEWTVNNNVGVFINAEKDTWIIHGQVEQRGVLDELGIVAIDANTGEVLGLDKISEH